MMEMSRKKRVPIKKISRVGIETVPLPEKTVKTALRKKRSRTNINEPELG